MTVSPPTGTVLPLQLPAVAQLVDTAPVQRRPVTITMFLLVPSEPAAAVPGSVSVAGLFSEFLIVPPLRPSDPVVE